MPAWAGLVHPHPEISTNNFPSRCGVGSAISSIAFLRAATAGLILPVGGLSDSESFFIGPLNEKEAVL